MQQIPVTNDASQRFTSVLGGVLFSFALRWQPLSGFWYADIDAGTAGTVLGRRVIAGETLLEYAQIGAIIAASPNNTQGNPGRTAWGDTHGLYWLTPDEVEVRR